MELDPRVRERVKNWYMVQMRTTGRAPSEQDIANEIRASIKAMEPEAVRSERNLAKIEGRAPTPTRVPAPLLGAGDYFQPSEEERGRGLVEMAIGSDLNADIPPSEEEMAARSEVLKNPELRKLYMQRSRQNTALAAGLGAAGIAGAVAAPAVGAATAGWPLIGQILAAGTVPAVAGGTQVGTQRLVETGSPTEAAKGFVEGFSKTELPTPSGGTVSVPSAAFGVVPRVLGEGFVRGGRAVSRLSPSVRTMEEAQAAGRIPAEGLPVEAGRKGVIKASQKAGSELLRELDASDEAMQGINRAQMSQLDVNAPADMRRVVESVESLSPVVPETGVPKFGSQEGPVQGFSKKYRVPESIKSETVTEQVPKTFADLPEEWRPRDPRQLEQQIPGQFKEVEKQIVKKTPADFAKTSKAELIEQRQYYKERAGFGKENIDLTPEELANRDIYFKLNQYLQGEGGVTGLKKVDALYSKWKDAKARFLETVTGTPRGPRSSALDFENLTPAQMSDLERESSYNIKDMAQMAKRLADYGEETERAILELGNLDEIAKDPVFGSILQELKDAKAWAKTRFTWDPTLPATSADDGGSRFWSLRRTPTINQLGRATASQVILPAADKVQAAMRGPGMWAPETFFQAADQRKKLEEEQASRISGRR